MITSQEEYNQMLYLIQTKNAPQLAILIPSTEPIYEIDLNSRTINGPENIGVESDHEAEIIYFKVDRYWENIDLSTTVCLIEYINASQEGKIYNVPFYDVDTYSEDNKILIPWVISNNTTNGSGKITYAFRFYKLDDNQKIVYDLNTQTTTTKVLSTIFKDNLESEKESEAASALEDIYSRIKEISEYDLYWYDL